MCKDINNKCVKLSLLLDKAISDGYTQNELLFIGKYIFKNVTSSYPYFLSVDKDSYKLEDRKNELHYLDSLSCDLTEHTKIGQSIFCGYDLMFDVLSEVYTVKELNTVDYIHINRLLEVTNKLTFEQIQNFDKVTELLKTVLLNYFANCEVVKLNNILKEHFKYYLNKIIDCDVVFEYNNSFFVTFDFKEYIKLDKKGLYSYLEDMINNFVFEDIELLIDVIL